MKIYKSITQQAVLDAVERGNVSLDNPGFCVACGAEAEGCEPDMRGGLCEACGNSTVYGAEELLFHVNWKKG